MNRRVALHCILEQSFEDGRHLSTAFGLTRHSFLRASFVNPD